jgi:hypothetical protein
MYDAADGVGGSGAGARAGRLWRARSKEQHNRAVPGARRCLHLNQPVAALGVVRRRVEHAQATEASNDGSGGGSSNSCCRHPGGGYAQGERGDKGADEAANTRLGRRPEGNLVPIHKYGACKWP